METKIGEMYDNLARSRIYSSLFSRRVVSEVLKGQYTSIDKICAFFEDNKEQKTYFEYFTYLYHFMMCYYRCEYVFKNELINVILMLHYALKDTILFSEFNVGRSIADLVMFKDISIAYEIKTDYDSDKRLIHQLNDYNKLFDKCYLVASSDGYNKYAKELPYNVGIITFEYNGDSLVPHIVKEAVLNEVIDIPTLMRSIRIVEYEGIVKELYGSLPVVSSFDMFDECEKLLANADNRKVRASFMRVIKQRKTNTQSLKQFDHCFRQLGLATHMTINEYNRFINNLSIPINIQYESENWRRI